MNNTQPGKVSVALASLAAELNPLKSFSFLLALGVTALAARAWLKESGQPQPRFPFYGTIALSYAAGFLIGRVFWRGVKIAAIVAAFVVGGLALLSRMHVDTSKARAAAEADSLWVRNEVGRAKHYLLHLLPSGSAAGVGVFAGGRRRGRDIAKDPITNPISEK